MRNPERIPYVLEEIKKLWEQRPDMRLGQMLYAIGCDFSVEDYDLLQSYADRTKKYEVDVSKFPEYWIEPNAWKQMLKNNTSNTSIIKEES